MPEPDPSAAATPDGVSPAVDPVLRETAHSAWTFGLIAVMLAMIAPCASYATLLGALPLGIAAMNRARVVLEAPTQVDEATQLYAQTGKVTGLAAAIYSGLWILILGTFVFLYVGMFAMVFGLIASVPPPPPPLPVP